MRIFRVVMLALVLLTALEPTSADAHGRRWHFYGGAWVWGWGLAPYYYGSYGYPPYPYAYPSAPSTVVIERAAPVAQPLQPQQQFWYYCESAKSYYPYVPTCNEGWKMVPVTPPALTPSGAPPQ